MRALDYVGFDLVGFTAANWEAVFEVMAEWVPRDLKEARSV